MNRLPSQSSDEDLFTACAGLTTDYTPRVGKPSSWIEKGMSDIRHFAKPCMISTCRREWKLPQVPRSGNLFVVQYDEKVRKRLYISLLKSSTQTRKMKLTNSYTIAPAMLARTATIGDCLVTLNSQREICFQVLIWHICEWRPVRITTYILVKPCALFLWRMT